MPKLSQMICLAVAGATCDGRVIEESWIDDMVATYDRKTYSARVNLEHLRGFSPEAPFNCYGDVDKLEKRTVDLAIGGKTEKRTALFGQVEATDALVTLSENKQKVYPSIEVNPNFGASGKAYLQGLAFTDSPASLGTEILTFAATMGDKNPFNSRKHAPGNYFSVAGEEVSLTFTEAPAHKETESAGLLAAATAFFTNLTKGTTPATPPPTPTLPKLEAANDNDPVAKLTALIGDGFAKLAAVIGAVSTETKADIVKLRGEQTALKTAVDTTDGGGAPRPAATGGGGKFAVTDC